MNCPYCGSEIREGEQFCRSCGAPLTAASAAQQTQQPFGTPPQEPAAPVTPAAPLSYKEFIKSPLCPRDVDKNIRFSWIVMLICAVISVAAQILNGMFPADGILMAALAIWLLVSKSFAAGLTAGIVGVIEMAVTSIAMHKFAGYLPALAGVYALTATLKARNLFKEYRSKNGLM